MEEQLVGFETAKLAKEKGFKPEHPSTDYVLGYKTNDEEDLVWRKAEFQEEDCTCEGNFLAPTQSLLQKWIREKHNLHIDIGWTPLNNGENIPFKTIKWWYMVSSIGTPSIDDNNKSFDTYEEAIEEGLFNALKLI